jgi:hypothetical protein
MITRTSHTYAVDQVLSALTYDEIMAEPRMAPELFELRMSENSSETVGSMGSLGSWSTKNEGQSPDEDEPVQQFKKTFTHTAKAKKVPISREVSDDANFPLMEDIALDIGQTAALTMEEDGASLFNNITTSAVFTSEDALAIASSAHLNSAAGNSQSNKGTNSLAFAGLGTTRLAMKAFTNYRGKAINVIPDELIVPDALEEKAWELIRSVGKPEVSNNDANFYNGRFTLYVWHFLTDTNAWGMMSSRLRRRFLRWYQRIAPEFFGDGDLFAGSRRFGGYMRYSLGCTDWRWIYWNNPS